MVINDKPTRVTSDTSTLIDLVICSKRNLITKNENNRAWNLPEGVICRSEFEERANGQRSTDFAKKKKTDFFAV